MKQLDTDRLRHKLRTAVDDVEQALQDMSDATSEQVGDLRSRAGRQLQNAGSHLGDVERHTAASLRRASRQAQSYARQHPWQVVGGLVAVVFAAALLSRTRQTQARH